MKFSFSNKLKRLNKISLFIIQYRPPLPIKRASSGSISTPSSTRSRQVSSAATSDYRAENYRATAKASGKVFLLMPFDIVCYVFFVKRHEINRIKLDDFVEN